MWHEELVSYAISQVGLTVFKRDDDHHWRAGPGVVYNLGVDDVNVYQTAGGVVHNCGRVRRDGQTEITTAVLLATDEGSDPPMMELLGVKRNQSEGIIDLGNIADIVETDESRMEKLAKYILEKA